MRSVSGIRGIVGDTLTPQVLVNHVKAFLEVTGARKVVIGRDSRPTGEAIVSFVSGLCRLAGADVIDVGLATTPSVELFVTRLHADAGIIITASHNPRQWNALKLLNNEGEFLTKADGNEVLDIAEKEDFNYADVDKMGKYHKDDSYNDKHIESVLALKLVDLEAIKNAHFKVCVDTINSVGGIILPTLLDKLGVEYKVLNCIPNGDFAHNPEPLEKNLGGIMDEMAKGEYNLGIVVDPDVDRLAFICENGKMFGEEYTLVSVADYILSNTPGGGNTVSNLSSTRALRDVTERHGGAYTAAAVGEVNVTTKMKEVGALIGGEGNGGVIYPESHYGRDALVGIALFLSSLAQKGCTASELRATLPDYQIAKNRIDLTPATDVDAILVKVKEMFGKEKDVTVTDIDGVKLDFPDKWVHLRKSNTEPIIRVYSEAQTMEEADAIGKKLMQVVYDMQK